MKRSAVAACCALFLLGTEAVAQQRQSCTGPQIGTWKLQSYTREDLATGQKTDLFGTRPTGYISYGPDCRMYAILIKEGRKAPASLVPTDAERIDLYAGLIAYAGSYTIDGDKVSHHIDVSWNQAPGPRRPRHASSELMARPCISGRFPRRTHWTAGKAPRC